MLPTVQIALLPLGKSLTVPKGTSLQDLLFSHGVEFPCGGHGRCQGCKIRILAGSLPVTAEDAQRLSPAELAEGWRLACRAKAEADLKIDLQQWETTVLTDDSVFAFTPRIGLGIAVDLGTTTLAAQLIDLETGHVLGVRTALNAQAQHGADIMSRVEFGCSSEGQQILQRFIRKQIEELIDSLLLPPALPVRDVKTIVIVGNTIMHHLFCGVPVEPMSHYPFEPVAPGLHEFSAQGLGWDIHGNPQVLFLPCLGGFVGSDILAGLLATRMHEKDSLNALIDLGTNGEIVIGNKDRLVCASTAAGPAFEGARISMGMRAATGAISEVDIQDGRLVCRVIGHGEARGICGSGLVDAVAAALDLALVKPSGRFTHGETLQLADSVQLNQWDIRELQLAKGAIAAGFRILLSQWGAAVTDLDQIYLAGAFGNYINQTSARRIGLLDFPAEKVMPAGNTALLGAKMALFTQGLTEKSYQGILERVKHVSLHEDPAFQDTYVENMTFGET